MYWIVILALGLALVVQHERARMREAHLRSALRAARNYANESIRAELEKPLDMPFAGGATLSKVISHIKSSTGWTATRTFYTKRLYVRNALFANGIPIYVDQVGLQEAGVSMQTPIKISSTGVPLKTSLHDLLDPLNLGYWVKDGLLFIGTKEDADWFTRGDRSLDDGIP